MLIKNSIPTFESIGHNFTFVEDPIYLSYTPQSFKRMISKYFVVVVVLDLIEFTVVYTTSHYLDHSGPERDIQGEWL